MPYFNINNSPNIYHASRKAPHRRLYEDLNSALRYHLFEDGTLVAVMANGAAPYPTLGSKMGCNIATDTAIDVFKDFCGISSNTLSLQEVLDSSGWDDLVEICLKMVLGELQIQAHENRCSVHTFVATLTIMVVSDSFFGYGTTGNPVIGAEYINPQTNKSELGYISTKNDYSTSVTSGMAQNNVATGFGSCKIYTVALMSNTFRRKASPSFLQPLFHILSQKKGADLHNLILQQYMNALSLPYKKEDAQLLAANFGKPENKRDAGPTSNDNGALRILWDQYFTTLPKIIAN